MSNGTNIRVQPDLQKEVAQLCNDKGWRIGEFANRALKNEIDYEKRKDEAAANVPARYNQQEEERYD